MTAGLLRFEAAPSRRIKFDFVKSITFALWISLTLACAIRSYSSPYRHTVFPIYTHSAGEWLAGHDLYQKVLTYDFFRYGPLVAVFFGPWRFLGDAWAGALWRVLGSALLAGGLNAWMRRIVPNLAAKDRWLVMLLVWPFLLQNVNNGQANTHLLGLLLLGTANVAAERYWRAAWLFAPAVVFKPYTIALVLLVGIAKPRLLARFAAALTVGLALPFATQSPEYVAGQYASWIRHLAANERAISDLSNCYRDLAIVFRVYFVHLPHGMYLAIQLVAAIGFAVLMWRCRRAQWETRELLALATGLGCCWMTVFGPATESCTYVLLAPTAALAAISHRSPASRVAYALLAATIAAGLFPRNWQVQAFGPQPIGGLIVTCLLVTDAVKKLRRPSKLMLPLAA